ncbi:MAG: caspase family protein [Spirochaetes bacterium]|nr:caspase family protein [Spirochaetota bacterium]
MKQKRRTAGVCLFPMILYYLMLSMTGGINSAYPQENGGRFALVIGNGNYEGMGKLANPVNDAEDMGETLSSLGFEVEVVTNAGLEQMEEAVLRLRNKLAGSPGSVGLFFYAGHGVQSGGENYLLPVDARINSESLLRTRAVPLQFVLDSLKEAKNKINLVILDACRDNPFSWARSSSRGLAVVGQQPPGSIVVYSTSAGRVAQDGTGRNSVFTEELIQHIRTPGIDISEVLRRTGEAVQNKTGGAQIPAIYSQFFGFLTLAEEGPTEEDTLLSNYLPSFFDEAPRDVQLSIASAEQYAQSGQRLEGWNQLMEADPSNTNPYLVAAKVRFVLEYGDPQYNPLKYSFYNTGDKDYETASSSGTLEKKTIEFDPHAVIQRFKARPEELPSVLALQLGNFYHQVYQYYPETGPLTKKEAQAQALRWYEVAEKQSILVEESEIRRYGSLLADQGKLDEAISLLRKKMQFFAGHDEAASENLWWFLVDTYSTGGRPAEALRELDERIREVLAGKRSTDLASLYEKGAEISIHHLRKNEFERYVSEMEKKYPDRQMQGGVLRHRYAVRSGDVKSAQALAERLYQRYPVPSILKENILEGILNNYLLYPEARKDGIAFLDTQIKVNQKDPQKSFELLIYRSIYQFRTHIDLAQQTGPEKEKAILVIRESLSDLNKAEGIYKKLPNQDPEILSIIPEIKKEMEKVLQSSR